MKKLIFVLSVLMLGAVSCTNDDDMATSTETGTVRIYLEHIGSKTTTESSDDSHTHAKGSSDGSGHSASIPFEVADNAFVTTEGDTFGLEKFQYLLSDFNLTFDGDTLDMEDVAFYVRQDLDNPEHEIYKLIENVPVGTYSDIRFVLGMNDEDNLTDNTTGELADAYNDGMVWTWDTGYKFARIEGHVIENADTNSMVKHIGGSGYQREIHIANEFVVGASSVTELHIQVNVSELFAGVTLSAATDHGSHAKNASEVDHNALIMDNFKTFFESPHHFTIVE